MLPNPFRVLELAFFQLDDLSAQFDTKLWRGVTYIITPPDRGVVGAAYSATVSRTRAILWLSLDVSYVFYTSHNGSRVALGPAAAACVFRPVEVGPAKEMLVGISLFSISSSLCKVGHVLFIPIGVQLEELLMYLLYSSFEYRRRYRGQFDLPLRDNYSVPFDGSIYREYLKDLRVAEF